MFNKLPSLHDFQPKFYTGGPTRCHLPLFYDLVALTKPKLIVTLGFADGQAHFTICQALRERRIAARCIGIRRHDESEREQDDAAWQAGQKYGDEFYSDLTLFSAASSPELVSEYHDGSIELLLLDEFDSGLEVREALAIWSPKLSPQALVLLHGAALERGDPPKAAWLEWTGKRPAVELNGGIGLGISRATPGEPARARMIEQIFGVDATEEELSALYRVVAERIAAQAEATQSAQASAAFEARQIWLNSLLADRRKVQDIMDHQARVIADLEQKFAPLRRDRAQAQLIMDAQLEQLRVAAAMADRLQVELAKVKADLKERKRILGEARQACRNKGRCFQDPTKPKERRSLPEKVLRELQRLPRNFRRTRALDAPQPLRQKPVSVSAEPKIDPYAAWISEHEPDDAALKQQRGASQKWQSRPKISLVVPVFNAPKTFLEEMLLSVATQSYENWEICLVDGGSDRPETLETLQRWKVQEPRLRAVRLEENLGVAENTNRALELATGDFIALADHDDLLAPFAFYEVARAILDHPEADIFYSDEDRWSAEGKRHAPFFKPEWSPALLTSSMYIGHLTAYRRDLVDSVGKFRKEFDLSQDYDFALRATERARAIQHIPHVLYHWREHPSSGSAGGKPEARKSNLAALAEAMRRRNLPAEIMEYPGANRARLMVSHWPRVSIIVPTDSPTRAQICLRDLPRRTKYPDLEIVLVTNSRLLESLRSLEPENASVRLVAYDKPFNFSEKCNLGAQEATGERLIFFNDDVEPVEAEWIQELTEQLENPQVGAAGPKMVYETGKIQHAGLVTGVRGLVGTACHQWPGDSPSYSNFAQSLRDVSALSAACLAIRKDDFLRFGEFDAVNTPIAHSDFDLCFKIRDAGLRCVYTPFVTMIHRGHASIGEIEREEKTASSEKASVYLLKRWAGYTCRDPYYPANVRDWLYLDSPTPIRMWGENQRNTSRRETDLLFVSHDLSWSGAPLILLHMAKWCKANGFFVVVMSPANGPLQERFTEAGIPVIVDSLATTVHPSFSEFAREFDCVVANTIFGAPVILATKPAGVPHLWWIHEGQVAEHYLNEDRGIRSALRMANLILAPDTRSAQIYQPFTEHSIRVSNYGIPDPRSATETVSPRGENKIRFLLLGTIEYRKGQRVFLEALRKLPEDILKQAEFQIIGRPHDPAIAREIKEATRECSQLSYREGVTHEEALNLIQDSDVMVSSSWDETGPLILMEALALGKPILSTNVGAVAEHLSSEESGLFFKPGDASALAAAIERFVREPRIIQELGEKSRLGYEKYFTFDRFAEDFANLVREAITSQSIDSAPIPVGL